MDVGDVLQILPSGLAGYAPAPSPSGLPTYLEVTHLVPKGTPGAATNFDFDIGTLFPNHALDIETKALGTTKGGTPNVIGAVDAPANFAVETRAGLPQFMTATVGGYKSIYQYNPDMIPVAPAGNDSTLLSAGFVAMSVAWVMVGGASTIMRCICTNQNGVNDADVKVIMRIYVKAAP